MEDSRRGLFVVALGLLMVAAESIRETTSVQLASELNVGFELLSSCAQKGSLNWEASELCQGRKPFQLYAAPGCYSYFWCSPELAACTTACPAGTLFNLACSCCQDSTAASAAGFDAATCSSTTSHAPQPQQQQQQQQLPQEVAEAVNARRQLLQAQPEGTQASQPSSSSSDGAIRSTDEMRAHARARARAMRRKRREAALRAAAAAAAASGDSPTSSSTAGDPAEVAATGDALEQAVHGGEHHSFVLNPRLRPMDQKPAAKAIDPEDEQAAPFAAALAVKQQQHQQIRVQQPAKQHSRPAGQQAMRRVPL
ncbi:hypothetical protein OEZ86_010616 [Tetradesmus obliquus]|nr:hypothetical protein OEZ86_010616 [Tetradesmus obliquus]